MAFSKSQLWHKSNPGTQAGARTSVSQCFGDRLTPNQSLVSPVVCGAGYHVSGSHMTTNEVKKEKGQLHIAVNELVNDTLTSF